jgi:hypothetical protein
MLHGRDFFAPSIALRRLGRLCDFGRRGMDVGGALAAELLLHGNGQMLRHGSPQFGGARDQKVPSFKLRQDQLGDVSEYARFVFHRLDHQGVFSVTRHTVGQQLAQPLAFDPKHLVHLTDLADEESAPFL